MSRLVRNDFIKAHRVGICINLLFRDFHDILRQWRKAKNAGRPKLIDGQVLTSPSELVTNLLKRIVKGDYVLESVANSTVQQLMLANEQDAQAILKIFPGQRQRMSPPGGCSSVTTSLVEHNEHLTMAVKLGLMQPLPKRPT